MDYIIYNSYQQINFSRNRKSEWKIGQIGNFVYLSVESKYFFSVNVPKFKNRNIWIDKKLWQKVENF